jgi:hypothetical protein
MTARVVDFTNFTAFYISKNITVKAGIDGDARRDFETNAVKKARRMTAA